jgi:hypothetical protein
MCRYRKIKQRPFKDERFKIHVERTVALVPQHETVSRFQDTDVLIDWVTESDSHSVTVCSAVAESARRRAGRHVLRAHSLAALSSIRILASGPKFRPRFPCMTYDDYAVTVTIAIRTLHE